jgi:hypothetical protein
MLNSFQLARQVRLAAEPRVGAVVFVAGSVLAKRSLAAEW